MRSKDNTNIIYICSKNVGPYIIIFVDGVTMMNRDVSLIAFHQSPPVTYLASPHTTPGSGDTRLLPVAQFIGAGTSQSSHLSSSSLHTHNSSSSTVAH